jgi:hypothetical protein
MAAPAFKAARLVIGICPSRLIVSKLCLYTIRRKVV